jgi:hypothetical protein
MTARLLLALLLGATAARAQVHTGDLAAGDDRFPSGEYADAFTVVAGAGGRLEAELSSSAFDAYLVVLAPSGARAENDDVDGSTTDARVVMAAAEAGAYTVYVTSYAPGETGPYRLTLRGAAPARAARPAGAGALAGTYLHDRAPAAGYHDGRGFRTDPADLDGAWLRLTADGRYEWSQLRRTRVGFSTSCYLRLYTYHAGRYALDGPRLTLTPDVQRGRRENRCSPGSDADYRPTLGPVTYEVRRGTDGAGGAVLELLGDIGYTFTLR